MSSIQDRIRRLESQDGLPDTSVPATGAVAKAKARLSRSENDGDAGTSRSVSNMASKFIPEKKGEERTATVSQLRERVTSAGKSTGGAVSARAAAFSSDKTATSGGAQVSARLGALEASEGAASKSGGVAARAGRFEKKEDTSSTVSSGLVTMRSGQLSEKEKREPSPSSGLSSRTALFENAKKNQPERPKTPPSRVAAATAAFANKASLGDKAEQPKMGKVASAAKDRELHEVRLELADMSAVSKELLSEVAKLRAGMREMEAMRDALLKRVDYLERKAK